MPILHPDPVRIPPHLHSEQEVLAALRTLPPDAHVFARLRILDAEANRDRELDFLVLHPDLGLVIVEVKGSGVEPQGDHWIRRHPDGREVRLAETPGEQLQAQQYALRQFLREAGLASIPKITRVLALPALPLREDQRLGSDLPACRILTRHKLRNPFLALREAVTGGLPWEEWKALPKAKANQVSPGVLQEILEALLPQMLPPPPLPELLAAEGRLQDLTSATLLDHLAQNFSRGRYHLQGGPGSGKSLLGRQITRLWVAEGRRVLVVAFNRALTYATQCALDDLIRKDQVLVTTYHDLAVTLLREAGRLPVCEHRPTFFNQQIPDAMAALLGGVDYHAELCWDALVVDEAQDLAPNWVRPLLNLLRHPEGDPVLLLEDPAQSIYREAHHDLGKPWRLDLNLRQHPAIRRLAWLAFPACGWDPPVETPDDGSVLQQGTSPETWKRDLAKNLGTLAEEGIQPNQVLILAPHRPETLGLKDGQILGPWHLNAVSDWWEDEKATHVRIGTVQSFKGLEADVVIYLAPAYRHPDAKRLAYTAYSRARHRLIVLEKAIPQPERPKAAEPEKAPVPPALPKVRLFNEGQRQTLMGALTAAKNWTPGQEKTKAPSPIPPSLRADSVEAP
jgi:hypothetical protein